MAVRLHKQHEKVTVSSLIMDGFRSLLTHIWRGVSFRGIACRETSLASITYLGR